MEIIWNKIYEFYSKKIEEIEKINDKLKKFSGVTAVGYTIFFLIIKCFEYAFELGRTYTNHMDRSYISINKEELLYQLIYAFAIFIVFGIVNYIYYFIGMNDNVKNRRIHKLYFYAIEAIVVFLIVIFIGNISIIELFKEVYNAENLEWLTIIIELIVLCFMINMFGIVFSFFDRKEKRKKVKKDCDNQEDNSKKEENNKQNKEELLIIFLKTILRMIIIIAIQIVLISAIGANFEKKKSNYKVLYVKCSKENKNSFFIDGKCVEVYPIIYEDKESVVVRRLEKNDNEIFINYNYQEFENKSGKKTRYIRNIFDENSWKRHQNAAKE